LRGAIVHATHSPDVLHGTHCDAGKGHIGPIKKNLWVVREKAYIIISSTNIPFSSSNEASVCGKDE
jgi:hypothetical protein